MVAMGWAVTGETRLFERDDEGAYGRLPSERLQAFTKAMWKALVPESGACLSVQGELVRANERLHAEYLRNGMSNYYQPASALTDTLYGSLLVFVLDTLLENRGHSLAEDDVHYFDTARRNAEPDWRTQLRIDALVELQEQEGRELTEAEKEELERLEAVDERLAWEALFNRAERCIANWCICNPELVDRNGNAVTERGLANVSQVFASQPAPPTCSRCRGRGWLPPPDPSSFPTICSCA